MNTALSVTLTATHPRFRPRYTAWLFLPLILVAGCRDEHVSAYDVPKEKSTTLANVSPTTAVAPHESSTLPVSAIPAAPGAAMTDSPVAIAAGPGLTWTAPAGWQVKTGNAMRRGSYTITGDAGATADLSITAFPGDVGGEVANVNRWRGQLQLTPLSGADATAALTRLDVNGVSVAFVAIVNPPTRLLGAMVPFGGATWFFKLTGPDALVAQEQPAFLAFLQTIKASTP